jgi:hypothetical protein
MRRKELAVVSNEDDVSAGPIINIPGGTRWIKVTNPHPTQIIKVKKSTDIAVFYVQEKPGQSQGRVNGTHRSDRQSFLRDYEPYTKRDWVAAQHVMAEVERARVVDDGVAEAITHTDETPTLVADKVDPDVQLMVPSVLGDAIEEVGEAMHEVAPPDQLAELLVEAQNAVPRAEQEAKIIPAPRRMRMGEIPDPEQEEIVDLWRGAIPVHEIAATYNTMPAVIYNVVSSRVPEEYRLQRIVDQLKRNNGPIPAYRAAQWLKVKTAEVADVCTTDAAQQVIHYYVDVPDPKKPWIKTPMIELVKPTPTESEPAMATTTPPTVKPTEAPVQFVINSTAPAETPQPTGRERNYRITVRTTVEDKVLAVDITSALDAAKAKYAGRGEVVAVMEE